MDKSFQRCDHLIIGAGPGGMAAAHAASQGGRKVIVLDENPTAGGQIWRGGGANHSSKLAKAWFRDFEPLSITRLWQTRVLSLTRPGLVRAESPEGVQEIAFENLILATGARERFLPFPGWTLPGVTGVGGLQALVKSGWDISGKRIVIAGTGPLLMAVAQSLQTKGAQVLCIAEQTTQQRMVRFGLEVLRHPDKCWQGLQMAAQLRGVPKHLNCWPVRAEGKGQLECVTLRQGNREWQVECDYLACGFDLVPNLEIAELFSCQIENGFLKIDDYQQTSTPQIFAIGELTGIGGVEKALTEGRIAGHAVNENWAEARRWFGQRQKYRRWTQALKEAFQLNDALKGLADNDTIICRCEDVTYQQMSSFSSWREAKLQTRCGMGACQGRICGTATSFMFDWKVRSSRPPVFPAPLKCFSKLHES